MENQEDLRVNSV